MSVNDLADGILHSRAGHRSLTQAVLQVDLFTCGMSCASSTLQVFSVRYFPFLSYVSGAVGGNGAAYQCGPSRKPVGPHGQGVAEGLWTG